MKAKEGKYHCRYQIKIRCTSDSSKRNLGQGTVIRIVAECCMKQVQIEHFRG